MKICVQTGGAVGQFGLDGAFRIIKEAGFDGVDANLNDLCPASVIRSLQPLPAVFTGDGREYLSLFLPYREAAEKYGLEISQVHCIYPSALPRLEWEQKAPEYNAQIEKAMEKYVTGTAEIGCHKMVVHPCDHIYADKVSQKEERERNVSLFSRLGKIAKREGVTICIENVFHSFGSNFLVGEASEPEDAIWYVDTLNEIVGGSTFGFCLDTGHAMVTSQDICRFITRLGKRLTCMHIHDNDGRADRHLSPYMGCIDWDGFTSALADTGYEGDLSFETFKIWERYGKEMGIRALRFLAETGRYFVSEIERKAT